MTELSKKLVKSRDEDKGHQHGKLVSIPSKIKEVNRAVLAGQATPHPGIGLSEAILV